MKQLELNLNKRLLIVEYETKAECAVEWALMHTFKNPNIVNHGHKVKPICNGSDLTEDIAKGFVEYDWIFKAYQYYQDTVPILGDTALNLFKTAIRNNGYYWDKPLKEWFYHKRYVGVERIEESFDYEKWEESESRTFNPKQTIIFKIL